MTRTRLTCILKTQDHTSHAFWLIDHLSNAAWQYVKRFFAQSQNAKRLVQNRPCVWSPRAYSRAVMTVHLKWKKKHFQQVCRTPPQFLPYIGTRVRVLEETGCYLRYCSSHDIIAEGLEGAGLYVIKLETGAYQTVDQIPALPSEASHHSERWCPREPRCRIGARRPLAQTDT